MNTSRTLHRWLLVVRSQIDRVFHEAGAFRKKHGADCCGRQRNLAASLLRPGRAAVRNAAALRPGHETEVDARLPLHVVIARSSCDEAIRTVSAEALRIASPRTQ
ncbi:hypothetical protein BJS_02792 [Bradyrhizobium japonicum SEMIA 5079]|nr:hypothetical protein BJS_02792 [Bradyrhizobium japonicum SEMIA 5079]